MNKPSYSNYTTSSDFHSSQFQDLNSIIFYKPPASNLNTFQNFRKAVVQSPNISLSKPQNSSPYKSRPKPQSSSHQKNAKSMDVPVSTPIFVVNNKKNYIIYNDIKCNNSFLTCEGPLICPIQDSEKKEFSSANKKTLNEHYQNIFQQIKVNTNPSDHYHQPLKTPCFGASTSFHKNTSKNHNQMEFSDSHQINSKFQDFSNNAKMLKTTPQKISSSGFQEKQKNQIDFQNQKIMQQETDNYYNQTLDPIIAYHGKQKNEAYKQKNVKNLEKTSYAKEKQQKREEPQKQDLLLSENNDYSNLQRSQKTSISSYSKEKQKNPSNFENHNLVSQNYPNDKKNAPTSEKTSELNMDQNEQKKKPSTFQNQDLVSQNFPNDKKNVTNSELNIDQKQNVTITKSEIENEQKRENPQNHVEKVKRGKKIEKTEIGYSTGDDSLQNSLHEKKEAGSKINAKSMEEEKKLEKKRWDKKEDDVLLVAFNNFPKCGKKINKWEYVASHFEDRNASQCKQRYKRLVKPDNVRKKWTEIEDKILKNAVEVEKLASWEIIADHLKAKGFPRTGKQVRERYKNHLDPSINLEPFKPEEDLIIMDLYKVYQNKWSKIAKHLINRSENAVKNRFHYHLKKNLNLDAKDLKLEEETNINKIETESFSDEDNTEINDQRYFELMGMDHENSVPKKITKGLSGASEQAHQNLKNLGSNENNVDF